MDWSALVERGRMTEARVELATLGRRIRDLRQPAHLWVEQTNKALIALMAGDYAEAAVWIARGSKTVPGPSGARRPGGRPQPSFLLSREVGRVADEEASLRGAVDDYPWYPFLRAMLALLLLDLGRDAEARRSSTGSPGTTSQPSTPTASGCSGWHWPARRADRRQGSGSRPLRTTRALRRPTRRGARRRKRGAIDRPLGLLAATLGGWTNRSITSRPPSG